MAEEKKKNILLSNLKDKSWWIGVCGNILSTVIGIGLTIGIGALVEHHNDQKKSREMMFNIVKACEENREVIAQYDSLFTSKVAAMDSLIKLYHTTHKFQDFSKEQQDSAFSYLQKLVYTEKIYFPESQLDKTFYSSQMMHQFGNPQVYFAFSRFVHFNQETENEIMDIFKESKEFATKIRTSIFIDEVTDVSKFYKDLIEDHQMTNYGHHMQQASLQTVLLIYKEYPKKLLKQMGATQEEYEAYKASIVEGHETPQSTYKDGKEVKK